MGEGALMCREEAWSDFEKIAEGRVLRTSVKKSTRGCGPPDGFNAGKNRQFWSPSGEAEGFTVAVSNAGQGKGWS